MSEVSCKECGEPIPETHIEPRQPCPNCGSEIRSYNFKVEKGEYKLTGYPVLLTTIKKVVINHPIISFLYFTITALSLIIGYVVPGIIGLILAIPLVYFAHHLGEERKEEQIHKEQH